LYILIFELPHIIASLIGFVDRGYFAAYKKYLVFGVPIMLATFYALYTANFTLAVGVYLAATMYHVIKQQTGIGHFFNLPKNFLHSGWTWSLIIGTAMMYIAFGLVEQLGYQAVYVMQYGAYVVLGGGWLFALLLAWHTKCRRAIVYLAAIMLMFSLSAYILWLGYLFFAFLTVRIVHDITAFIFYIVHDMNRNYTTAYNLLYQWGPYRPWSLLVIVPLVAMFLDAVIRFTITDSMIVYLIVMTLGFSHYYLESLIWKRGAPHRAYVRVV
jgi:hypothetical protein